MLISQSRGVPTRLQQIIEIRIIGGLIPESYIDAITSFMIIGHVK